MNNDIFERIESMPETEIERLFQHIIQKVEAFAKLLHLDTSTTNYFKQVIKTALSLYLTIEESSGGLREGDNLEDCISLIASMQSTDLNKVEETMYLARDISREFLMLSSTTHA